MRVYTDQCGKTWVDRGLGWVGESNRGLGLSTRLPAGPVITSTGPYAPIGPVWPMPVSAPKKPTYPTCGANEGLPTIGSAVPARAYKGGGVPEGMMDALFCCNTYEEYTNGKLTKSWVECDRPTAK